MTQVVGGEGGAFSEVAGSGVCNLELIRYNARIKGVLPPLSSLG